MPKTAADVFDGLTTWIALSKGLKEKGITTYEVKQDITTVEISGNKIIIPPHLERIVSELLKEPYND